MKTKMTPAQIEAAETDILLASFAELADRAPKGATFVTVGSAFIACLNDRLAHAGNPITESDWLGADDE